LHAARLPLTAFDLKYPPLTPNTILIIPAAIAINFIANTATGERAYVYHRRGYYN
jgi:hypothetical protein